MELRNALHLTGTGISTGFAMCEYRDPGGVRTEQQPDHARAKSVSHAYQAGSLNSDGDARLDTVVVAEFRLNRVSAC